MKKNEFIEKYGEEAYIKKQEYNKKYREEHKEYFKYKWKEYQEQNKEKLKEKRHKYHIENKERCNERHKEWMKENEERCKEYHKKHYEENKEYYKEYEKKRNSTQIGRAKSLIRSYKTSDKKHGYGETTLTPEQLVTLMNCGCYWCGESDWNKLGADRIDNTKPHTLENCVCSCWSCNNERQKVSFDDFKKLKGLIN